MKLDTTNEFDLITGKTVHQRRLETCVEMAALDDGQCVKEYNGTAACVICDATAVQISPSLQYLMHRREGCQAEFDQVMLFAHYLEERRAPADLDGAISCCDGD